MRRLPWWCLGLGFGAYGMGCGLVLDASPHVDAHVEADARVADDAGMDARVSDDTGPLPDVRHDDDALVLLDTGGNTDPDVGMDAPLPSPDAFETPMDAHVSIPDAGLDARLPTDTGHPLDARFDASFDAWFDAGRDAGRDAGPDAPTCTTDRTCAPRLDDFGGRCVMPMCTAGVCGDSMYGVACPASGGCVRSCAWSGAAVTCSYSGARCAPLLAPCSSSDQCPAATECRNIGCATNACVPTGCAEGMSCPISVAGTVVLGTCSSGACIPLDLPSWCALM
ncbi:MAG: hypothetical protein K1X94_08885 [Sandaracinaceae bacterium]|nr:hypothetical protein [Sandaracinaceae bacterium]